MHPFIALEDEEQPCWK